MLVSGDEIRIVARASASNAGQAGFALQDRYPFALFALDKTNNSHVRRGVLDKMRTRKQITVRSTSAQPRPQIRLRGQSQSPGGNGGQQHGRGRLNGAASSLPQTNLNGRLLQPNELGYWHNLGIFPEALEPLGRLQNLLNDARATLAGLGIGNLRLLCEQAKIAMPAGASDRTLADSLLAESDTATLVHLREFLRRRTEAVEAVYGQAFRGRQRSGLASAAERIFAKATREPQAADETAAAVSTESIAPGGGLRANSLAVSTNVV